MEKLPHGSKHERFYFAFFTLLSVTTKKYILNDRIKHTRKNDILNSQSSQFNFKTMLYILLSARNSLNTKWMIFKEIKLKEEKIF